jgi:hypothetical protein
MKPLEVLVPDLYFTSAPDQEEKYQVGDKIEVFCDHEINGDRIRDWLEGTVVQVDAKMLAVQFQDKVYLTDGWMVPDHVLWCRKDSSNIRHINKRRRRPRPRAVRSGNNPGMDNDAIKEPDFEAGEDE